MLALAGCTPPPKADPARLDVYSGVAEARDGDTISIHGQLLDLWGIEAPNLSNSDGWYARAALDDIIGPNGELTCTVKRKSSRRLYAVCSNNKIGDVGRAMIEGGWAVVARSDKKDEKLDGALAGVYSRSEKRARESRIGLWAKLPNR